MKCQNGGCGACEACTAAYDWGAGGAAGGLYDQAKDAWHRAGMEGMSAKDRSRFCDMLERIAAFLQAARVAQQDYASPMLENQMQQLSDATWEMDAPSQLSDPGQIARAERVLDGRIMPSVNGIASVVKSVSKKGRKKGPAVAVSIKALPSLQAGIEQDRNAIVADFTRYRTSVTRAQMSARAQASRQARVSKGALATGPSASSVRASLPKPARKTGGTWSAAMAMAQGGAVAGSSGSGRQRQQGEGRSGGHAAAARPDLLGRIGSHVSSAFNTYSADAFSIPSFGDDGPITYPRMAFGLDSRSGQDLFAGPGTSEAHNFSEPIASGSRDDRLLYVQSSSGANASQGRITR